LFICNLWGTLKSPVFHKKSAFVAAFLQKLLKSKQVYSPTCKRGSESKKPLPQQQVFASEFYVLYILSRVVLSTWFEVVYIEQLGMLLAFSVDMGSGMSSKS